MNNDAAGNGGGFGRRGRGGGGGGRGRGRGGGGGGQGRGMHSGRARRGNHPYFGGDDRARSQQQQQQQQQAQQVDQAGPLENEWADEEAVIEAAPAKASGGQTVHLSDIKFADLAQQGVLCPPTYRAIKEVIGHERLTEVQAKTLMEILNGDDCLAQAKTGTGKTLGFLVPAIENLHRRWTGSKTLPSPTTVSVLVISPTRELAQQIAAEATALLTFHPFQVQCCVGGTNMNSEARRLNSNSPKERVDILVATPGRLQDHLENSGLKANCSNLTMLILDEADQLLSAGFRREIEKILTYLPKRIVCPRQTLLFSATIPQAVHEVAALALLPTHKFITTVSESDSSTHDHVTQYSIVVDWADSLAVTLGVIQDMIAADPTSFKIIVFFPTARTTQLAAEMVNKGIRGVDVFEIHSRKSQSVRTKATDAFRVASKGIMFSSDVSARGMDFPNVTAVIQVGLPSSREQYVHRLGRTARAGAQGTGTLILSSPESFFLRKQVSDLPITPHPSSAKLLTPARLQPLRAQTSQALSQVSAETKSMAYAAMLGFYKTSIKDMMWTREQLVEECNKYAVNVLGCDGVPSIPRQTVGKMGMSGVAGLNIEEGGGGGRGRGRGGRGGGGGGGRGGGGGGGGGRGRF
ncbi:hypothetical protein HDU67_008499 [Dinochytrium kinnereticum]|nr:hypothetical protein HDU67_008499 [Dinochytrium kinnereticum]